VLAYVFWHTLRGADTDGYESGLTGFHRALATDPPEGFARSWTLRLDRPAWLPDAPAHYVDWYLVDGFGALGPLNDGAVSGSRRNPHDAVAGLARTGTAGILGPIAGNGRRPPTGPELQLALVDKPAGESYDAFRAALVGAAPGITWWMRQMTLGPGAEFIAVADAGAGLAALPWPATILRARALGASPPQAW
jgi:hypothetical protein